MGKLIEFLGGDEGGQIVGVVKKIFILPPYITDPTP